MLLQAPVWVRDESMPIPDGAIFRDPHSRGIGNGNQVEIPYMGWRVIFYVLQLGQLYIEMARIQLEKHQAQQ